MLKNIERQRVSESKRRDKVSERRYIDIYIEI